ncbi:electron transfer flavoprotein, alpha subunit [Candidatus Gastranaerophilus sp. (ex Termes propinquus)]|nr:electron transfer flavoprotein, alpha subunit [Candidatus Gastranaerophilus sp. (ex Termes propinquus)]
MTCVQDIFVYAQKNVDVTYELLGAARGLVKGEQKVCAFVFSPGENVQGEYFENLFRAGADKIFNIVHGKLGAYNSDYYSEAAVQLIGREKPSIVLIGATHQGRDLAPRVSCALNTGLTADCTGLEIIAHSSGYKLAATRPTFGGQLMATILCKTNPQMATVRENVLKRLDYVYENAQETELFTPDLEETTTGVRVLEFVRNAGGQSALNEAEIVLAGGRGLKKESFEKLAEIVKILNEKGYKAALGASRAAVDLGFAEHSAQVGQTGNTVSPKIYAALGISGSVQHLSGMGASGYVIAVNSDPDAPIFQNCDFGIVQDAQVLLDDMLKNLR